jgi:endo-1,4-beta-mannosidase
VRSGAFTTGVNYWPARSAMAWWKSFDAREVAEDFRRIRSVGFDSVRIFLTWEDFQSTPTSVEARSIQRLVTTVDLAGLAGLSVVPTLFTGHMSGVNWIPPWALGDDPSDPRFRCISAGLVGPSRLTNWYTDTTILHAQSLLAREVAHALAGHDGLLAWDLGNENSNCSRPPDRASARRWLARTSDAIRDADPRAKVTIGLHMEDLEEDRMLGPREASDFCDFLTMHGYPGYARWAGGPTDERLLPFLTHVTRWLGNGADVLFSEFGVPTHPPGPAAALAQGPALVDEAAAASYVARGLRALEGAGAMGAMIWCYTDYPASIWDAPPLDLAPHERSFGVFRADGSEKPAASAVRSFTADLAERFPSLAPDSPVQTTDPKLFLDLDPADFYRAPKDTLARLFDRYCAVSALSTSAS